MRAWLLSSFFSIESRDQKAAASEAFHSARAEASALDARAARAAALDAQVALGLLHHVGNKRLCTASAVSLGAVSALGLEARRPQGNGCGYPRTALK